MFCVFVVFIFLCRKCTSFSSLNEIVTCIDGSAKILTESHFFHSSILTLFFADFLPFGELKEVLYDLNTNNYIVLVSIYTVSTQDTRKIGEPHDEKMKSFSRTRT